MGMGRCGKRLKRRNSCPRGAMSATMRAAVCGAVRSGCLAFVAGLAASGHAWAQAGSMARAPSPGMQCRSAVAAAETSGGIPAKLLAAISRVESGRPDGTSGHIDPWPWSVNADGQSYVFATKDQAIAAVTTMEASGVRSIDVGCGQINLMYHPNAFPNLEVAFDPVANANYAARFLHALFVRTGDWTKAAGMYHSATPAFGAPYLQKVLTAWPAGKRILGPAAPTRLESLAKALGATLSGSSPDFGWNARMLPVSLEAARPSRTTRLARLEIARIRSLN